jgi:hypothetical protein
MMKFISLKNFLRWLVCIGAYWVGIILYPYSFYYQNVFTPKMTLLQTLILLGTFVVAGSLLWLIYGSIHRIGKYIGMERNLILYFLYHFAIGAIYALVVDRILVPFRIEPNEMYLLLGFFPAMLYSVIYSYERSHNR